MPSTDTVAVTGTMDSGDPTLIDEVSPVATMVTSWSTKEAPLSEPEPVAETVYVTGAAEAASAAPTRARTEARRIDGIFIPRSGSAIFVPQRGGHRRRS